MSTIDTTEKRERGDAALFDAAVLVAAMRAAFAKLAPRHLLRSPVMAVVMGGTLLAAVITASGHSHAGFGWAVTAILFVTVLFGNFAEAIAEARGRGQAASLRRARKDLVARRVETALGGRETRVPAAELRPGDYVMVSEGEFVPADGEIVFKVTAEPGHSFLDRMIALVEGANRQKTPNEIALTLLLAAMTLTFLIVVASLPAIAGFVGVTLDPLLLIALLVCLIPTTIGGLLPAIGIAGMNRALSANVLAKSGKAVEVAGDVDVLLLDKTGTITYGDRQATTFHPLAGVDRAQLRDAAMLASLADPTPEGKSIVKLARQQGAVAVEAEGGHFIAFTAQTRMSGVDIGGRSIRKGAGDAIVAYVQAQGATVSPELQGRIEDVARGGATPLVVAEGRHVLGVVELSDVVKQGIKEKFAQLRAMGIKTVMITGDNPLTAAAIAAEAGVDDYIAQARPEDKLARIRAEQTGGRLVAMVGDGTNDAPALAQADVGLAMNSGTQAAKEAGNMVDLDSDPAKLLAVVEVGKQQLITRGALTTFSLANDVSKYFAILPALFAAAIPSMAALNVMQLSSPRHAVLAALIFNALIIPALIPLALRGVRFRPSSATALLRRNMLIYGVGGVLLPFAAIKVIDLALVAVLGA
ncbi:potassium-transporting ATPase subunit KdpB [Xanthomonas euvesicatoria]|uniref:potassium-transporting ATPase subunit KdpB n=1 Tax=Xanthomonas euvesicatoria TaxID=456327 RepID=UPI000F8CBEE0|nr:potassium-transporting ATPase subunit KdpB [Xanthomonas euvesicatoria]